MKIVLRSIFCLSGLTVFLLTAAHSQEIPTGPDIRPKQLGPTFSAPQPASENSMRWKIPGKKVSQYTPDDWGAWIDSAWGPGQPVAEQLQIFDTWWNLNDRQSAAFANHLINWDSVKNVYRPQIGSGLSRGKFYALMSRMWLALMEFHTVVYDPVVESAYYGQYRSGFPLAISGPWWWDALGAPVAVLPDSTCVVYRVAPANPLGLERGDLVLGFEGVPWKDLYRNLLKAGVPLSAQSSQIGTTPESMTYALLAAVGWNWGMFETIDIVKYSSGDTLHLPTAQLGNLAQTVMGSDQVPIAGVPMPAAPFSDHAVSWAVIPGTNIGYIYCWDWEGSATSSLFQAAVNDLCRTKAVTGLILDLRMNLGSTSTHAAANAGLSILFNIDPTTNGYIVRRYDPMNHLGFTFDTELPGFAASAYPFDHPIAVLIGPGCYSVGDYNAFRMRFHPMARSFGKPTNGAFVYGVPEGSLVGGWRYRFMQRTHYSRVAGEGYLVHKGVQPDEEVWLTRDGVAKGEDDVVNRALAWITQLTYAHSVDVNKDTLRTSSDSILVTAILENLGNHAVALSCVVTNAQGTPTDSVLLANDGLHGDGAPNDSVWGTFIRSPSINGRYTVSVRTDDLTTGTFRRLPAVAYFVLVTSVGDVAWILPKYFSLDQNYPNPFNPSTTIRFDLPQSSEVRLSVFDLLGREVSVLVNERREASYHSVEFNASNLSSGVYFYRLHARQSPKDVGGQAGDFVQTRKLLLIR